MSRDSEFDAVIAAVARMSGRPKMTREQQEAIERENHRKDPKHIKALAKRRKRKRGGPK